MHGESSVGSGRLDGETSDVTVVGNQPNATLKRSEDQRYSHAADDRHSNLPEKVVIKPHLHPAVLLPAEARFLRLSGSLSPSARITAPAANSGPMRAYC
jgi:hypothetical protein